ncbi:gliding motility protein GldN [Dysgonomonas sp. 25]|uniref:type IX secretion system ring protein PorN/GldN n=1 Tax=Dysgonomonas sp. 25 TaxID=2302933 RepID=UPI0013D11F98|nr:gliding motility protein GldN [Dysgonomonas sp. 25]NDV68756.1 gliding motility protein GldN [Dysgonomonas sp. 25]
MKRIYQLSIILLLCIVSTQTAAAQESLRDRLAKKQQQSQPQGAKTPEMTVRAQMFNDEQTQDMSNATWMREIYRFVDISKGRNAALVYPTQPIGNRMSLYTMIFKLMAQDKLTVYEYMTAREVFTDEYKVDFKTVLEKLNIPIQQQGTGYVYNEYDIPANDVMGYYVKEGWYFDNTTGTMDVKIIAICPVLTFYDDYGIGGERAPQFWIPYENIRPYAANMPIMVSEKNNVLNNSIDDFFRLRMYEGEIYKTGNMANKVLTEIYKTPEELEAAREKIESELIEFDKRLWVTNDSSYLKSDIEKGIKPKNKNKTKRDQPKGAKGSGGSGAKYSARDRR